jgi:hypothetical protein
LFAFSLLFLSRVVVVLAVEVFGRRSADVAHVELCDKKTISILKEVGVDDKTKK